MTQPDASKNSNPVPHFWAFSSENRILLSVILIISTLFVVGAVTIYGRYQAAISQRYEQFGQLIASAVAAGADIQLRDSTVRPAVGLRPFADAIMGMSEDVAAIEIYDRNGNRLYEQHKKNLDGINLRNFEEIIDFSAPLQGHHNIVQGQVHVKLTGQTVRDLTGTTKTLVIIVFLSAWTISILAVMLNTYMLSKHLRTLVRGVKRLSSGDFGYKISESDLWGELKQLAESFNDMSIRLRAYEDQNLDTITLERNKLEAILLSIADGVVVCDNTGQIGILNQAACGLLGAKSSELLIGTNIRDYMTMEGEKCFEPVLNDFQTQIVEASRKGVTGERRGKPYRAPAVFSRTVELPGLALKVMVSPIHDAAGENLGFVMIMHDVTKETEVDKLKTNFISNVSHELRTPVTTIKSYVDTIYNHGEDLDEETYKEFIETIHIETDRLKKLVNDILDFSRLEAGGYKMEREWQDIGPVINLTVQSVKVLAQQKNLTLTTAIESQLPKVYINSDAIERVMRNLLSNAIKYTEENGRIKVRAELAADNQSLEVSVQDNGIGIPEEHLPFIFDRFYRVENKVHTVKGTGLGLHLVKVAVETHHQGEVFVRSQPNIGSTFGFRIPLTVTAEDAVTPEQTRPSAEVLFDDDTELDDPLMA
jgi:two-component system sensor histidine kinase NblS